MEPPCVLLSLREIMFAVRPDPLLLSLQDHLSYTAEHVHPIDIMYALTSSGVADGACCSAGLFLTDILELDLVTRLTWEVDA